MIDSRTGGALWTSGRCLVYARCSKEDQDASITDQLETIAGDRKRFGLELAHPEFVDDGLKGHDETRPALRAVLAFVMAHPNPVRRNSDFIPILVYDVSRFGRFDDPKKVFAYFVEVERYGYEFYSVTERIRSRGNISDFVQLIIKGEQAYDYSVTLSKYAMRTALQLAQKGWWPGGSSPYGYDRMTYGPDGKPKYRYDTMPDKSVRKYTPEGALVETLPPIEDKGRTRSAYSDKLKGDRVKLVPGDARRIKVIQEIFSAFAESGRGLKGIAYDLNVKGITAPRGRCWTPLTIRSIIRNPAYRGALVYGRRSDGKHHWLDIGRTADGYAPRIERKDVPGRVFVHRTVEECIVVEDGHPAIVSPGLWRKAEDRLRLQKESKGHADGRSGRAVRSEYLLSGDRLMKCVHCGYSFNGRKDPRSKRRYYYDAGYHAGGTSVCRCTYVPADEVESWVLSRIAFRLFGEQGPSDQQLAGLEKGIAEHLEASGPAASPAVNQRDVERRLDERRRKLRLIVSELDRETLELVREEIQKLKGEIRALEGELERARALEEAAATEEPQVRAKRLVARMRKIKRVIEKGTPEERKAFVRDFVAGIEIDGRKGEMVVSFYAPPTDGNGKCYLWEWCPQRDSNPCPGLERAVS